VVRYQLSSATSDGTFAIDSVSGELRTVGAIDHEMKTSYRLAVLAVDTAHLFNSTADVIVRVIDVNDNAPTLRRPETTICVGRTTSRGQKVGRVEAADADEGPNAVLQFRWINLDNDVGTALFQLSKDDGHVIARTDARAYVRRRFRFRVTVEDLGVPARSAFGTVSIVLNDTCDVDVVATQGGSAVDKWHTVLVVSALCGTALGVGIIAVCAYRRSHRELSTPRHELALSSDACRRNAVSLSMQRESVTLPHIST